MRGALMSPFRLVIYDVDHFKQINDAYGHQVGDQVLIKLSGFVAKRMRETDLLARWGGEEFVILLPSSDASMAERFAEILRSAIATLPFDHGKPVTCSFGVAQMAMGESAERFIARADEALYRAKLNGRNRVERAEQPWRWPKRKRIGRVTGLWRCRTGRGRKGLPCILAE